MNNGISSGTNAGAGGWSARRRPPRCVLRPGEKLRVLVVDDSVVVRRMVTQVLTEDPRVEVVGSASNGMVALQRIRQLKPHALTLDVEMPEMNGLDTLRQIQAEHIEVRVIMFSTLTMRGAKVAVEALSLGADDYVTKPEGTGSIDAATARLRTELVPKLIQFFDFGERTPPVAAPAPMARPVAAAPVTLVPRQRPALIAVGVSTGGPTALPAVINSLPAGFPLPVVVTQHMPPMFTRLLAERMQQSSRIPVTEAAEGMLIEPGHVYLAPGDYHLRFKRQGAQVRAMLDQGPPENSCRPAVDVMLRAVQSVWGGAVVAVILTGMGHDGLDGARRLKSTGATIIAQDEESSVVWGMPGAVARAGIADAVAPLDQIASLLIRASGQRSAA